MNRETKKDIQEVISALTFCETEGRSCKKCKDKDTQCLLFLRTSIAVCLKLLMDNKVKKDEMHI